MLQIPHQKRAEHRSNYQAKWLGLEATSAFDHKEDLIFRPTFVLASNGAKMDRIT